jgi:GH25 family lysozyme M1 (1,4-beta-N-acetylmuramidase)
MSSRIRSIRRRRALVLAGSVMVGLGPGLVAGDVATAPPAAAAGQARGIDVANYQHPNGAGIDWNAVRGSGIEFAFIKATEGPVRCTGNYYTNSWLRRDWNDSAAAGLYRGAYHFARPGDINSAINQARYFVNAVGPMNRANDLPPVLDLEANCGLDANQMVAWTRAWVDEVTRLTGRDPIIYSGYYFWKDYMGNTAAFSNLPFWIATYGPRPLVPPVWSNYTFWQYSSSGQVPGINGAVDMNLFSGSGDQLSRLTVANASSPFGAFDGVSGGRGTVQVGGWAADPDGPAPIQVHVYVDGVARMAVNADQYRPDVGAAFPAAGPGHGFNATLTNVVGGDHQVCVYGINAGPGFNNLVGCKSTSVAHTEPLGVFDTATGGFRDAHVTGWAFDPDTGGSIPVHVYVDGVIRLATQADRPRFDVAAAIPGVNGYHGFDVSVPDVGPGRHTVCTYGINVAGYGDNMTLGCKDISVLGGNPIGGIFNVTMSPGTMRIKGWALDSNTPASIPVHVYVDGRVQGVPATGNVPEVGNYFVPYGPNHGFDLTWPGIGAGTHTVCAYAISVTGGPNTPIGCQAFPIFAGSPLGFLDGAAGGPGSLTVQGWTIDPDTTQSAVVHVYVDGVPRQAVAANGQRPDVAVNSSLNGYGIDHGYATTITGLAPGDHTACTYGINVSGGGNNVLLGCRAFRSY